MGFIVRQMIRRGWEQVRKQDLARIARQTPTPGVGEDVDLAYLDDGDPMHLLDIYYPAGTKGLLPTIVDIHGGGWMYGDKELNKYYCLYLAAQGFAVANISYRLLPNTDLLGQVQDIFAALHWLEKHGSQHHCDLSRFYICGDSAGGHLTGPGLPLACNLAPNCKQFTVCGQPDCISKRSASATACASSPIFAVSAEPWAPETASIRKCSACFSARNRSLRHATEKRVLRKRPKAWSFRLFSSSAAKPIRCTIIILSYWIGT
ncbi:hypothetical protein PAE9249_04086 [Paenibacillus sp. CECT 9249]|uniref:alpha/beta hydrolase n=1 Tax=Paenibacillus sp. CECT 9249 TaxID=2845385 RepID=UPI001E6186A1|nr:alpha/beta hydrolase [Paenibacillus sp. CECT 9249]CAH0121555.1 hypothetical protein PAE9249_04086 [Paenibacillus sp. CECT 9249]